MNEVSFFLAEPVTKKLPQMDNKWHVSFNRKRLSGLSREFHGALGMTPKVISEYSV